MGDNGYALAAPSKLATGSYEIIHGHLDDLDRLTPMVGIEAPTPSIPAGDPAQCIRAGRRNTELWRYCMKQAHACADRITLVSAAQAFNVQNCSPPLAEEETLMIASSAWAYTERGDNRFGQHGCYFRTEEITNMLNDQDSLVLLAFLRAHNGPWATFMCANGLADLLSWHRKRLAIARRRLIELGYLVPLRQAGRGHPALFRWREHNRASKKEGGRSC